MSPWWFALPIGSVTIVTLWAVVTAWREQPRHGDGCPTLASGAACEGCAG